MTKTKIRVIAFAGWMTASLAMASVLTLIDKI